MKLVVLIILLNMIFIAKFAGEQDESLRTVASETVEMNQK